MNMLDMYADRISGIQAAIMNEPDRPNARKKYALEISRLGRRLYSDSGRVVWCGICAPFEVLNAMGLTACFVEFMGGMVASLGAERPMLEEAEQAGHAAEMCGHHKAVIGSVRKGFMPEPAFLIGTTSYCSGGLAVIELLAKQFGKDLFVLHVPQDNTSKNVQYLADQISNMVEFITDHTGEQLDRHELAKAINLSNRAREILVDMYEIGRSVPSPIRSKDLRNFGILMPLFLGTEAAVNIAQAFKDELISRLETDTNAIPDERLRLMWLQSRIQFNNPVMDWLENQHGAAVVVDETNLVHWPPLDPDDPFTGLANRIITLGFNGPIEQRINVVTKLAKDYQVDGAINPCHWGCRQSSGPRGIIHEALKEINVPVLNLDVDTVDSRNFAEGQLKTRIEAFVEVLKSRNRSS
jgi:benzoyl-CoA reductase/2-hydroxyglutaryl-CoA dehydratase subunit BcrC/BadD/HgdB